MKTYNVCVTRTLPYVEDLWYDFNDLEEAKGYANDYARMYGVDEVTIYDEDENVIEVYN